MIGCEPGEVEEVGLGLTPAGRGGRRARARRWSRETIDELRTDAAYRLMHEFSIASAVVDTARAPRRRPARDAS